MTEYLQVIFIFSLAPMALLAERGGKPNVLMIAIDDLRPELHPYGVEKVHTPCESAC